MAGGGGRGMSFHPASPGRWAFRSGGGPWSAVLLVACLLIMSGPIGARAQGIATAPPPVRSSVDANGVDLITGALVVASPQLSIGQGEGAGDQIDTVGVDAGADRRRRG